MNDTILHKQLDPLNYEVWLSSQQYEDHIKSRHPEIEPEHIRQVIASPRLIFKGNQPNTREYFGESIKFPNYLTQVSVAEYKDYGDVRTAYTVKAVGKNVIPAEKGGCIYVGISNKL